MVRISTWMSEIKGDGKKWQFVVGVWECSQKGSIESFELEGPLKVTSSIFLAMCRDIDREIRLLRARKTQKLDSDADICSLQRDSNTSMGGGSTSKSKVQRTSTLRQKILRSCVQMDITSVPVFHTHN